MPQSTRIPRTCLYCGKVFTAFPSVVAYGGANFCSRPCNARGKGLSPPKPEKITRICRHCGKSFTAIPAQKTCSKQCGFKEKATFKPEEFWAKVDKSGECWIWIGRRVCGYGVHRGPDRKYHGCHRLAWILTNGDPPEGLYVCHNCPNVDNKLCVRPSHMFLGTPQENVQDAVAKGTWSMGSRHCWATTNEDQVRYIRKRFAEGAITPAELAQETGVSRTNIYSIIHRKSWKHVKA